MLQTVVAVVGAVVLVAALWAAREALLLIYISALTAMGFSPLVRLIERPRPDDGRRRVPGGHGRHSQLLPARRSGTDVRVHRAIRPGRTARGRGDRGAGGGPACQRVAARATGARGRDGHVRGRRTLVDVGPVLLRD